MLHFISLIKKYYMGKGIEKKVLLFGYEARSFEIHFSCNSDASFVALGVICPNTS